MFTGLIEDVGIVSQVDRTGVNLLLQVRTGLPVAEIHIGDSININGFCQTVVRIEGSLFIVEVSPETQAVTTVSDLKSGDRVNLERALSFGGRLGGHLVLGHVDGVGRITRLTDERTFKVIQIEAPESIIRYCIPKGSVAVDGISLTLNDVLDNKISVGIIPHTLSKTNLKEKKVGDKVNIEADLIGKYVERFLRTTGAIKGMNSTSVDLDLLAKTGFLD